MAQEGAPPTLLTSGEIKPHLMRLGIPMVIGVFAMISVNLVDTYFVGLLGTQELAAMSFTFPLVGLIINVCMGLGIGVMATVARLVGAGKNEEEQLISTNALSLAACLSVTLGVIGYFSQNQIFSVMGAEGELLPYLNAYMKWWFVGMPFLVILIIANAVMRAHGDSKTPMRIMIGAAILNGILDPLLIFGWGAIPALGLEGASIATMIARLMTFGIAITLLIRRGSVSVRELSLSGMIQAARGVASVGLPAALTNALTPFSAGLMTALIALHGEAAIAGYGYAVRFEGLFLLVPMVMGGALSPFIGQNWGAHLNHRVVEALGIARRVSIYWGGIICLSLWLGASSLAQVLSSDLQVQAYLSLYLRVLSISYAFQGVIYAANSTFNAVNRPLRATIISMLNGLVVALPLAYLGHHWAGFEGIIYGLLSARLITGMIADRWVWRLFEEDDRQIALSDQEVKTSLYQLEEALPGISVKLERMLAQLGHLPDLTFSGSGAGHLTCLLKGYEVAHLFDDGRFDILLPPQLRDAVVEAGWGQHHRREYDGGWVTHDLKVCQDVDDLIRLICLTQAYLICLEDPSPESEAKSPVGKVCEVTRTMEARAELNQLCLPRGVFMGLVASIGSARVVANEDEHVA